MVTDDPTAQHRGLARQVGIELHATEGGGEGVQPGLGQVEPGDAGEVLGRSLQGGLGDQQEVPEVEVAPGHP